MTPAPAEGGVGRRGARAVKRMLKRISPKPPPAAPAVNKGVELVWWRPSSGEYNFGDLLSKIVVDKILADQGFTLFDAVPRPTRLLGIGSVLHLARDGDTVWGSGVNGKIPETAHVFEDLDVRAVRGPLTAEFLAARKITAPEVFGDPALLLPRLFPGRFAPTRNKPHVFVPNLHDLPLVTLQPDVVSPLLAWNTCVERILEAEFVLASSLHGLIIAEAYGLPARYVRLSETEGLFKFEDYMRGTGRKDFEFARSIEEGLEMGGAPPITFDPDRLLNAFPIDLWLV